MAKLIISISLNLNRGLKIIILIRNYIFLLTINSSMLLKAFIKERVAEIVLNCKFKYLSFTLWVIKLLILL